MGLNLNQKQAEKILGRSYSTIEKAYHRHQLKRGHPEHISWTLERLALMKKYWEESRTPKSQNDSMALLKKMLDEMNKLLGPHLTINAIRMKARDCRLGAWGLHNTQAGATKNQKASEGCILEQHRKKRKGQLNVGVTISENKLEIKSGAVESGAQEGACVGLWSRIDFGGNGYRKGLVRLAGQVCQQKGTHFIILVGGLVDKRVIDSELIEYVKLIKKSDWWKAVPKEEKEHELAEERLAFCHQKAVQLAADIPHIRKPNGKLARIYIITSPAYDGVVGKMIAKHLSEIRSEDIVFWGHGTDVEHPLPVKYADKTVLPVVPVKAVWRSRYYTTSAQRLIQDIEKRSPKKLPDINVVGCLGGSVDRPMGESRRAWAMIPVLHNITETHSAENQVGISFIQFESTGEHTITNRSFKGLLSCEREFVKKPADLTKLQDKIFELLVKSAVRVGIVEYQLKAAREGHTRDRIKTELDDLTKKSCVVFDEGSDLYDFSPEVLSRQISYPNPDLATYCKEDSVVGFGCLHAGAVYSDYEFFVNEVPKIILKRRANLFVAAGDLTQGLYHGLLERGEIVAGINNTQQERLAAHLIGEVISRVFKKRFADKRKSDEKDALSSEKIQKTINECLLDFLWVPGNHDDWQKRAGTTPLEVFEHCLIDYVVATIKTTAGEHLPPIDLHELVKSRIFKDDMTNKIHYVSPITGLAYKAAHPGTARTETASISAERALEKWRRANVVIPANWHVAVRVEHFNPDDEDPKKNVAQGQRLALQCPTICTHTHFEDGKIKTTDFGVGVARIRSHNKHIVEVEAGFCGKPTREDDYNNEDFINDLLKQIGCMPI